MKLDAYRFREEWRYSPRVRISHENFDIGSLCLIELFSYLSWLVAKRSDSSYNEDAINQLLQVISDSTMMTTQFNMVDTLQRGRQKTKNIEIMCKQKWYILQISHYMSLLIYLCIVYSYKLNCTVQCITIHRPRAETKPIVLVQANPIWRKWLVFLCFIHYLIPIYY